MITAIDTNVFVALWDRDPGLNAAAQRTMDIHAVRGRLVIAAPVYCELIAAPGRTADFVEAFLRETNVEVDWALSEAVWRNAGRAFWEHAERRRRRREGGPRRILADFLIGAHALCRADRLLTLDEGLYRAAFPSLRVETFGDLGRESVE